MDTEIMPAENRSPNLPDSYFKVISHRMPMVEDEGKIHIDSGDPAKLIRRLSRSSNVDKEMIHYNPLQQTQKGSLAGAPPSEFSEAAAGFDIENPRAIDIEDSPPGELLGPRPGEIRIDIESPPGELLVPRPGEIRIVIESPNIKRDQSANYNDDPSTERLAKLAETTLGICASAGAINNSSSNFARAANAAGFVASLTAISLRSTGRGLRATRLLAKFAAIACAAGTIAAFGKDLPQDYMCLTLTGVIILIPATAVAFA